MRIFKIKLWNVGQGLAIHVLTPDGQYIVIDLGADFYVSPISSIRNGDIGCLILTHAHLDHIKEIEKLKLSNHTLIWRNPCYKRTDNGFRPNIYDWSAMEKYRELMEDLSYSRKSGELMASWAAFGGLNVRVFSSVDCEKNNVNNSSAIVVMVFGKAKIVICGDNEKESLAKLMEDPEFRSAVANASVLVAPHHGHESGYYEPFVKLVSPFLTVISDKNKSHDSAVEKYSRQSCGCNVHDPRSLCIIKRSCLTTSTDGNIVIELGNAVNGLYCGIIDVIFNIADSDF